MRMEVNVLVRGLVSPLLIAAIIVCIERGVRGSVPEEVGERGKGLPVPRLWTADGSSCEREQDALQSVQHDLRQGRHPVALTSGTRPRLQARVVHANRHAPSVRLGVNIVPAAPSSPPESVQWRSSYCATRVLTTVRTTSADSKRLGCGVAGGG